jgi:3-hydroxyisobutyrate dehydrogenase
VALAETIALAEDLGLDPESFLEVIGRGAMGVEYTELNGPAMIARDFPLNFPLALARRTLRSRSSRRQTRPGSRC